jgi:hypothetical protein
MKITMIMTMSMLKWMWVINIKIFEYFWIQNLKILEENSLTFQILKENFNIFEGEDDHIWKNNFTISKVFKFILTMSSSSSLIQELSNDFSRILNGYSTLCQVLATGVVLVLGATAVRRAFPRILQQLQSIGQNSSNGVLTLSPQQIIQRLISALT